MKTAIALGSNIGDRLQNLQRARDALVALHCGSSPLRCSKVYETAPAGCAAGTRSFLNAVVELECDCDPLALLGALRGIETGLGRAAVRAPNAPRAIDLDIIVYGGCSLREPSLTIPHPRAHERRFVLQPLQDICPDWIFPGQHESVAGLLKNLPAREPVEVFAETW